MKRGVASRAETKAQKRLQKAALVTPSTALPVDGVENIFDGLVRVDSIDFPGRQQDGPQEALEELRTDPAR